MPNLDLEGLLSLFEHDWAHFSKMVASLIPIMNMLTSGSLAPLLSANPPQAIPADVFILAYAVNVLLANTHKRV